MKKLVSVLLALTLVLSVLAFVGCGSDEPQETDTDSNMTDESQDMTDDTADDTMEQEDSSDGSVDIGIVLPTKEEPRWVQDEARF